MKKLFEEPRMELKAFAIQDTTLLSSGDIPLGENELDSTCGADAYGTTAIG